MYLNSRLLSNVSEPSMSDGIKSGVNWILLKSRWRASEIVCTKRVLANPGTPTSKLCPWQNIEVKRSRTTSSCPLIILEISLVNSW